MQLMPSLSDISCLSLVAVEAKTCLSPKYVSQDVSGVDRAMYGPINAGTVTWNNFNVLVLSSAMDWLLLSSRSFMTVLTPFQFAIQVCVIVVACYCDMLWCFFYLALLLSPISHVTRRAHFKTRITRRPRTNSLMGHSLFLFIRQRVRMQMIPLFVLTTSALPSAICCRNGTAQQSSRKYLWLHSPSGTMSGTLKGLVIVCHLLTCYLSIHLT